MKWQDLHYSAILAVPQLNNSADCADQITLRFAQFLNKCWSYTLGVIWPSWLYLTLVYFKLLCLKFHMHFVHNWENCTKSANIVRSVKTVIRILKKYAAFHFKINPWMLYMHTQVLLVTHLFHTTKWPQSSSSVVLPWERILRAYFRRFLPFPEQDFSLYSCFLLIRFVVYRRHWDSLKYRSSSCTLCRLSGSYFDWWS